jgi:tRNA(Ile2) C34 agmatinyltransferase TiaS
MILDKSNLNDKDLREFLIEKCSVGYLADYIIKLRNDNKAVKNLTICDVSQRSEQLLCKDCGGKIDSLDNWCKHCGEVIP